MLHIEQRYVQLLAPRLNRFKTKSSTLFNCKCPYCEAGTTDRKARGYIYEREAHLFFYCHRCSVSKSLARFIQDVDPALHMEFVRERLLEQSGPALPPLRAEPPKRFIEKSWDGLVRLTSLPDHHTARRWADSRRLPDSALHDLWYADDFYGWARRIAPDKYEGAGVEPRVVIPFRGRDGEPVGFQGRALTDSSAKYVTLVTRPDEAFLFGLDKIREDEPIIALEGPIDAMFIDNAVATGGGDLTRELARSGLDQSKVVVIVTYDNERRAKHTIKKMRQAVERGWPVCMWPESVKAKDVNDIVKTGTDPTTLRQIILASSRRGPQALAALAGWSRC